MILVVYYLYGYVVYSVFDCIMKIWNYENLNDTLTFVLLTFTTLT